MRTTRILLVGALGVMLGGSIPMPARAQTMPVWTGPRPALEAFYAQQRVDGAGGLRADGVGAKLMWNTAPTADPARSSWLANHASVGLFGVYTPEQHLGFSTVHGGVVADVRPFAQPLAGRIEPFASLGVGALRTNVRDDADTRRSKPSPLLAKSIVTAALSPGIGARATLVPGVALQGDLRDVLTFRGGTRHNVGFGLGLRVQW